MIKYFLLITGLTIFISCRENQNTGVIATSAWTAAYARAAGIDTVTILAPSGMQHPTEYELNIEDIKKIKGARLIIGGGYEIMMNEIKNGMDIDSDKILVIKTDYDFKHLAESIRRIAVKEGSEEKAESGIRKIENAFEEARTMISQSGLDRETYIVQFFLQSFAKELNLQVAEVFGPSHLEAYDINSLLNTNFTMILDNEHNPVAGPLVEARDSVNIAYLINFPGTHGTRSLVDVIRYNTDRILQAAGKQDVSGR